MLSRLRVVSIASAMVLACWVGLLTPSTAHAASCDRNVEDCVRFVPSPADVGSVVAIRSATRGRRLHALDCPNPGDAAFLLYWVDPTFTPKLTATPKIYPGDESVASGPFHYRKDSMVVDQRRGNSPSVGRPQSLRVRPCGIIRGRRDGTAPHGRLAQLVRALA